jgi:hypothetical protein
VLEWFSTLSSEEAEGLYQLLLKLHGHLDTVSHTAAGTIG